jgi:predicted RNase H-like HicB family nuclease
MAEADLTRAIGYDACTERMKDRAMARPIVIHADWDAEAGVWVATTKDMRGLVTEAESIEALRAKLPGMIIDLLEEYGISDQPASIEIIARASDRLTAAE